MPSPMILKNQINNKFFIQNMENAGCSAKDDITTQLNAALCGCYGMVVGHRVVAGGHLGGHVQ